MLYALAILAGCSAGCAQCAPGRVAQGVSRLTIRNFGAMVDLVNNDPSCGFESPEVLANYTVSGRPGQLGKVTWTVTDCIIDIPADRPLVPLHPHFATFCGPAVLSTRR